MPARTEGGRYNAATARELLAMTSEFPDTKKRHARPAQQVPARALRYRD